MFRKILIANDGSEGASRALEVALELAKRLDSEIHMISVEEIPRFSTTIDEVIEDKADANHVLRRATGRARFQASSLGIKLHLHLVAGHAVSSIVDFASRENVDLLVVGSMGHSALYNRVLGSTTDRLVEHAACQVLVVK
jgi:nucleotide-binding universal stress UspA family protein